MDTTTGQTDTVAERPSSATDGPRTRARFRPWRVLRFSLRTMLLATAVLAVWLAVLQHRAHRQRDAVAAIRDFGGWVRYDFQVPSGEFSHKDFDAEAESPWPRSLLERIGVDFFHDVVQVNLNYTEDGGPRQENHNPSDDALRHLPALPDLRVLLLSDTQARDDSMRHLAGLTKLELLYMWDVSEVTDEGAAHLGRLRNLRYVHLSNSQATDTTLKMLADLPEVTGLSLQFNRFSDDGVKRVSRNPRIETLWICGRRDSDTPITDASFKYLERMPNLKTVGLQHTQVTAAGLARFRDDHPGCRVVHHRHQ